MIVGVSSSCKIKIGTWACSRSKDSSKTFLWLFFKLEGFCFFYFQCLKGIPCRGWCDIGQLLRPPSVVVASLLHSVRGCKGLSEGLACSQLFQLTVATSTHFRPQFNKIPFFGCSSLGFFHSFSFSSV